MKPTAVILLSLVSGLCLETAFAEGETQQIGPQNAEKIINIGVMHGNIINNQYGVPQKAVDRLLKELDDRGIKLQQREQAIAEWVQKYKDLEIQLALRTDDTAKQAKAFLAEGNLEKAEKLFKQALDHELANLKQATLQAAQNAFSLAQIKDLQYETQAAIAYYQQSLQLNPDNADGWNRLAALYFRTGELDQAISAWQTVLKLGQAHQNQQEIAMAYSNLGLVYYTRGELDKAIEIYNKALSLNGALGNKQGMAINYSNLGLVHRIRGELDKSIEMYQKSLAITKSLGDKEKMAAIYGNLGNVYYIRVELDKAFEMHNKALAIDEKMGNKQGMAINYGNLGNVYHIRGELDKAVEMHNKALSLNEELGIKEGMAQNYGNLGNVYQQKGSKTEAKRYYQKAIELFKYIGSPNAEKAQKLLDDLK